MKTAEAKQFVMLVERLIDSRISVPHPSVSQSTSEAREDLTDFLARVLVLRPENVGAVATTPHGNDSCAGVLQPHGGHDGDRQGMSGTSPCPWCGAPVEVQKMGSHSRRFCNDQHRNAYNAAVGRWSRWYAALLTTPGALKDAVLPPCTPRRGTSVASEAAE